jgi:hypothetical protein
MPVSRQSGANVIQIPISDIDQKHPPDNTTTHLTCRHVNAPPPIGPFDPTAYLLSP